MDRLVPLVPLLLSLSSLSPASLVKPTPYSDSSVAWTVQPLGTEVKRQDPSSPPGVPHARDVLEAG